MKAIGAGVIAIGLALPATARAFGDHELFDAPAVEGGGGSRYFTGSRADGYACSVCHGTTAATEFSIQGLPRTVVPGQRYEIAIRWSEPDAPHSVHVELSNPDGSHPTVTTIPGPMLPAESRCGHADTGEPALYVLDRGPRRVIGVEPCGASGFSIGFTAGTGPIELAVAGVRGNKDDSAAGDRTFEQRVVIGETLEVPSGCATGGGATSWGMLVVLGLISRRRATR